MDKKDLTYFKKLLEKMLQEVEFEISNGHKIEDEDSRLPDDNDIASLQYEQAFHIRMKERNEKYAKKIRKALKRVEHNCYGECEECGNEISIKRLKSRPVATVCIECKREMEQEEKGGK